jgi:hypothetical protein
VLRQRMIEKASNSIAAGQEVYLTSSQASKPVVEGFRHISITCYVMNDLGPSKHHLTFRYQLSQVIS